MREEKRENNRVKYGFYCHVDVFPHKVWRDDECKLGCTPAFNPNKGPGTWTSLLDLPTDHLMQTYANSKGFRELTSSERSFYPFARRVLSQEANCQWPDLNIYTINLSH